MWNYLPAATGHRCNTMDNRNGRHLMSTSTSASSSSDEITTIHEQASNRERELQKQLDTARRELEEERERVWAPEADVEVALSAVEGELCEFNNQLESMRMCLETEHRDWEAIRGRLETQVERERLKVRSRDVQIHQLKLSKEQETAALSNQLTATRNRLETENRSLREQLAAVTTTHPPL